MQLGLKLIHVLSSPGPTDWLKWVVHQVDGQLWASKIEGGFWGLFVFFPCNSQGRPTLALFRALLKLAISLDLSKDTCGRKHPEILLAA